MQLAPIISYGQSHPAAVFAALVILPGLGFPSSPLLILAGALWGATWQSCLIGIAATATNMSWTYLLAVRPARTLLTRLLGHRWERWKTVSPSNLLRLTILLRVTPGVPLFVQNYLLGLLGVPFLKYLLISVPLNSIYVIGFVLTGGAIFQGSSGLAITGLLILAAAATLVHMIRSKITSDPPNCSL